MKLFNDIFGIKSRRRERLAREEAERLEAVNAQKRRYKERKEKITAFLDKYLEDSAKEAEATNEAEIARYEKETSKCPKCGSENVINKFKRTKGELHADASFHSNSSLFFHASSGKAKADGELDTFPINSCKDCGNEWIAEKPKLFSPINEYDPWSSPSPRFLYKRVAEYLTMEYDPYDTKELANSLEEKRADLCAKTSVSKLLESYKHAPRYMLEYAIFLGMTEFMFREQVDERIGLKEGDDKYSFSVPDDVWVVVKKLLDWSRSE